MFPALVVMGILGGLSQAPMFTAAGTLSPDWATTGSAVLNMSRQVGSAVGVAILIALTAGGNPINGFDHAWEVQTGVGLLAAGFLFGLRQPEPCELIYGLSNIDRGPRAVPAGLTRLRWAS
jgi:hypothetical protein